MDWMGRKPTHYHHIYSHTQVEGIKTIQHHTYLCGQKNSSESIPLTNNLDFMKEWTNSNESFKETLCPVCKEMLDKKYPIN